MGRRSELKVRETPHPLSQKSGKPRQNCETSLKITLNRLKQIKRMFWDILTHLGTFWARRALNVNIFFLPGLKKGKPLPFRRKKAFLNRRLCEKINFLWSITRILLYIYIYLDIDTGRRPNNRERRQLKLIKQQRSNRAASAHAATTAVSA
jgi:hypothetical protein